MHLRRHISPSQTPLVYKRKAIHTDHVCHIHPLFDKFSGWVAELSSPFSHSFSGRTWKRRWGIRRWGKYPSSVPSISSTTSLPAPQQTKAAFRSQRKKGSGEIFTIDLGDNWIRPTRDKSCSTKLHICGHRTSAYGTVSLGFANLEQVCLTALLCM